MKNVQNALRKGMGWVLVLPVPLCFSSTAAELHPDLVMHGESYSNVCKSSEKNALLQTIMKSNTTEVEAAWHAVDTILCAPRDRGSRSYVDGLLPRTVRKHSSSTGDKDAVGSVVKSDALVEEIMAKGKAWNVELRIEPKKIYLQYFKDEACVREVVLSFINKKWLVTEIGEACD